MTNLKIARLGVISHKLSAMSSSRQRGFTLTELLVVIAIIGILSGFVTVSLLTARSQGRDHQRETDLATMAQLVELYRSEHKTYPANSSFEDVSTLSDELVPAYTTKLPADPSLKRPASYTYGTGYVYYSDGARFALDASLERNVDQSLMNLSIRPLEYTHQDFYQGGFYKDSAGIVHFRVTN